MKILVTGAGGFIGRTVTRHLLHKGHYVSAIVRRGTSISLDHPHLQWHVGDIRNMTFLETCMRDTDIVVHLAAAKSDEPDSYAINVTGTKNLLSACRQSGVKGIIHISTISTKLSKKGVYGNTKHAADEAVRASGIPAVILKPSVVYGDMHTGIFGTLIGYTKLPIVPVIGPGTFTSRPIHVDDVSLAIEQVLSRPLPPQCTIYDLGGPDTVSFNELILLIAKQIHQKNVFLFHIPISVALVLARILEVLMKKPPITMSNVIATAQDVKVDAEVFYHEYDFRPRSLKQGLKDIADHERSERSNKEKESYALMRYILPDAQISTYHTDLFEQAVIAYDLGTHRISPILLRSPWCIGAFDAVTRFSRRSGAFQRKLLIAAAIIECSPLSSDWLLPKERNISRLAVDAFLYGSRSAGKLILGIFLICIPGLYKHNA